MDIKQLLNDDIDERRIARPQLSGRAAVVASAAGDERSGARIHAQRSPRQGHAAPLPALPPMSTTRTSSSSSSVAPARHPHRLPSPITASSTTTAPAKGTTPAALTSSSSSTSSPRSSATPSSTAAHQHHHNHHQHHHSAATTLPLPFRQQQKRSPSSSATTSASPFASTTSSASSSSSSSYHPYPRPHHRPSAIASLRKNSSSSSASSARTMDSSYSTPFLSRSNSGDSAYHSPATPISPSHSDGLGFSTYGGGFDPGFQRPPLINHSSSYMAHQQHIDPYGMLQGFQFPSGQSPDSYPDSIEPCSPSKKDSPSSQGESPSGKPKRKTSYPCPCAVEFQCPNVFTTSGHAARHAKVHTGEKNAVCPECKKAFTRKDNMEQHRKIHNGHKQPSRSEDRTRKNKIQQARKARRPSSISTVGSLSSHDIGIDVAAAQAYYPHSASTDYSPMSFQHAQFSPAAAAAPSYLDTQFDSSHMNADLSHFYSHMPISSAGNMQVHSLDALALAAESSR